jgi:hypothetical protein
MRDSRLLRVSIQPLTHMTPAHKHQHPKSHHSHPSPSVTSKMRVPVIFIAILVLIAVGFFLLRPKGDSQEERAAGNTTQQSNAGTESTDKWLARAQVIDRRFHDVYTPCWEGANGAIGDAYLFARTGDTTLLNFHLVTHDLRKMCVGTWVDDRAWVALAELYWWRFTGRMNMQLIQDAQQRYLEARAEGRLAKVDGYWTWYNWPPTAAVGERIFTNSNMNQMATVACGLFEATGNTRFRDDALLVWNGDRSTPGIEKALYKGNGVWAGRSGRAAFGKELPWNGAEYCTIGAAMYKMTGEKKYRDIVVATAKHITDPATGWLDPADYFQIHMDGNGNFVHYLLDAYEIAPEELSAIPGIIEKMLEHVWTNSYGRATVVLHREADHSIRNGWNPHGGEDGYGVDEVGTVHAQSQAVRAFGVFAYFAGKLGK